MAKRWRQYLSLKMEKKNGFMYFNPQSIFSFPSICMMYHLPLNVSFLFPYNQRIQLFYVIPPFSILFLSSLDIHVKLFCFVPHFVFRFLSSFVCFLEEHGMECYILLNFFKTFFFPFDFEFTFLTYFLWGRTCTY